MSHPGEDGDEPALPVKLLPEAPTNAAQQRSEEVLIASTELTVLEVILQQPDAHTDRHEQLSSETLDVTEVDSGADSPEQVVSDANVPDGSPQEETNQRAVQVTLVLQSLRHRERLQTSTPTGLPSCCTSTSYLYQLRQEIQQLRVGDGIHPLDRRPPQLLIWEPEAHAMMSHSAGENFFIIVIITPEEQSCPCSTSTRR